MHSTVFLVNLVIHFSLKSGKSQKVRESSEFLLKKLGGNHEVVSHNFEEFAGLKACFLRGK